MNRYGQSITWSTVSAPHVFTGVCTSYTYDLQKQRNLEEDEVGDIDALILHSEKAQVRFDARVTDGSDDFLDLSSGAAVEVSGITGGVLLVSQSTERWTLMQAKTASITATHYPDVSQLTPVMAGATVDLMSPEQDLDGLVMPGGVLTYSTIGLTHASGVVHGLTLTQTLTLSEDEPSPDGKIVGVAAHGYHREASLELLATSAAPAIGSTLAITGAPARAGGYKIESVSERRAHKRGMMYTIGAIWIPPFAE